jgi:hypothetical protein
MRRSVLLSVLAGVTVLAAGCSSDDPAASPMEPAAELAPDTEASLRLRCRDNGLIVVQLARILSAKPPARLYQQAIQQFALIEFALLTRKKALAQTRALALIDFLADNRANLINPASPETSTRLGNVIDAILCIVGLPPTGVELESNTGVGVVPANNPAPVIITTPEGEAGLRVPTGGAPSEDVDGNPIPGVVVTVSLVDDTLRTPLDKYGQTIDLTASQEVLWQAGGVAVAICVTADDAVFDRLRLGHEGGVLPKFGEIEILPQAAEGDVDQILDNCGPDEFGSLSTFDRLRQLAKSLLLPRPLHAAALAEKSGGVGGTTRKFSLFGAVDPDLALVPLPASTSGTTGQAVAQPPSVLVRTRTVGTPIAGVEVDFDVPDGSPGTISPTTVTTNADGVAATTTWTLGEGLNTVNATPESPSAAPAEPITFTPPAVTFTAVGAPPAPDFGAEDWSYLIRSDMPASTGWTTLPWPVIEEGWEQAGAPFGSVPLSGTSPSGCADQAPTTWPVNTVILLRRDFFVPAGTTSASISVKIDNDTRVFLNGVELGGIRTHEGCAETNLLPPLTVLAGSESPLIVGGVNQLAVLGRDRGTESFVDVEVTLAP